MVIFAPVMTEEEDKTLREALRNRLNADIDAQIRALEEDRKLGHHWITGVPSSLLAFFTSNYDSFLAAQSYQNKATSAPSSSVNGDKQYRFPYTDSIRRLLEDVAPTVDISTPPVYLALKEQYEEIRNNPKPVNVKAQIANTLNRLASEEEGFLRLHRKGGGSIPHTYRRTIKLNLRVPKEEVTETGDAEAVEADIKEGDLLARADV